MRGSDAQQAGMCPSSSSGGGLRKGIPSAKENSVVGLVKGQQVSSISFNPDFSAACRTCNRRQKKGGKADRTR